MNQFKQEFMDLRQSVRPLQNIADSLREALDDPSQFAVRYQPIIDGKTKQAEFAEALIRWTSPIFGEIMPGRFISVAEKHGLIRRVTKMVLRKVCENVSKHSDLVVSVNISPLDIIDPEFPSEVASAVADFGVDTRQIIMEVTDRISAQEANLAAANLRKLREQGHAVAIYQLETGFTSFGFLKIRGFTLLKIEKELFDEALESREAREQLQDALNGAHANGFKSLAVGIETEEQAKLVEQMGFDLQQGFFHSESLSLEELLSFSGGNTQDLSDISD